MFQLRNIGGAAAGVLCMYVLLSVFLLETKGLKYLTQRCEA
jgi:hypothetical protein